MANPNDALQKKLEKFRNDNPSFVDLHNKEAAKLNADNVILTGLPTMEYVVHQLQGMNRLPKVENKVLPVANEGSSIPDVSQKTQFYSTGGLLGLLFQPNRKAKEKPTSTDSNENRPTRNKNTK